ncbi:Os09g0550850 [Oryza sativa Japonica Group]|uniref:Os09g0550850 protein n=1 Tax=Oryza sativa subsp. japonica TaxID=39947 RepID=A0A0P0XQL2_ORYSJ|nr:Os09g0550850 [Oryza sativa Japonica Group]
MGMLLSFLIPGISKPQQILLWQVAILSFLVGAGFIGLYLKLSLTDITEKMCDILYELTVRDLTDRIARYLPVPFLSLARYHFAMCGGRVARSFHIILDRSLGCGNTGTDAASAPGDSGGCCRG